MQNTIEPHPILQQLQELLIEATQFKDGRRCTRTLLYLIKVMNHVIIPDDKSEKVQWRLAYKAVIRSNLSKVTKEAKLNCKIGVLSKTAWDSMQVAQKRDLQNEEVRSNSHLNMPCENKLIQLHSDELQQNVLVIEIWKSPKNDKPFIGRTHCELQDLSLLSTSVKELTLYSHSKKNEKGNISFQLGLRAPPSNASEVFDSYETLFRAIVKCESHIEGNKCARMWSAQLPLVARDLLHAHATLFEIGVLQRVAIELGVLMDYHIQDGVNINAFLPLLEELEKAFSTKEEDKTLDLPPANGANYKETKPDDLAVFPSPMATPIRRESNPISPLSTISEVTSPFSGESLTFAYAEQDAASTTKSTTVSKSVTESEYDEEVASPTPCSPQPTRSKEEWPEKYDLKQKLNELRCYIEEKLNKHLFIFDITKPELEEHLRILKMLYTLHPVMDPQHSGSNFQTALKKCVENGVQHWISVCNAQAEPDKGGRQYKAASLKALSEACKAKCTEVKNNIGDLFKKFDVDYFPIFIQSVGSKLSQFSISKETVHTLDEETVTLYYQAYRACKQIEECANSSLSERLKLWRSYEPLVGSWIEAACNECKKRINKAIENDKLVKITAEVNHSSSLVDVEGFLHKMINFWEALDWPDHEEAFGYGSQHLKNFFQCVVYYVETSYQHFSETYLQEKFSVTETVCVFLSNVTRMKIQALELSLKLQIKPTEAATKTLDALRADEDINIEQKIQSCMKQICERLIPDIVERLRSSDEQLVERITEFLDTNLTIFKENLPNDIYRHKILHLVWNITLQAIKMQLAESRDETERQKLNSALMSLKNFFNPVLKDEELQTPQYKEVEVQCLPAKDLISQCCLELVQQQPEITESSSIGELSFSIVYLEEKLALEVNILNAKLVSQEGNKDDSIETCVQVWLLPQVVFQGCAKIKYKTDWKKTQSPIYYKELHLSAELEGLRKDGAILVCAIHFKGRKRISGLCAVPCKDVPLLQNESGRKKITLPLFLPKMNESGPLKELKDRPHSRDEQTADFMKMMDYFLN